MRSCHDIPLGTITPPYFYCLQGHFSTLLLLAAMLAILDCARCHLAISWFSCETWLLPTWPTGHRHHWLVCSNHTCMARAGVKWPVAIPLVPIVCNNNTDTVLIKWLPSNYLLVQSSPEEAVFNIFEFKMQPELVNISTPLQDSQLNQPGTTPSKTSSLHHGQG